MGTLLCQTGGADEPASCHRLTQLLVPGLEQRAWQFPPLAGIQASPGAAATTETGSDDCRSCCCAQWRLCVSMRHHAGQLKHAPRWRYFPGLHGGSSSREHSHLCSRAAGMSNMCDVCRVLAGTVAAVVHWLALGST